MSLILIIMRGKEVIDRLLIKKKKYYFHQGIKLYSILEYIHLLAENDVNNKKQS